MKLDDVRLDSKKMEEGEWVQWPEHPEVWVKVKGEWSPEYRRAAQPALGKLRRKYGDLDNVPIDEQDRVLGKLYAKHLIVDVTGFDDVPEYTEEVGILIMTDPEFRHFRREIERAAGYVGKQEAEALETDAKNSKSGSASKSK